MTTVPNDPAARPLAWRTDPQSGRLHLTLETYGLGCTGVRLPPSAHLASARLPFRLGPLECEAQIDGTPDVGYGLRDGMTTTTWTVRLVGVPESFAVADLLEGLGGEVTR